MKDQKLKNLLTLKVLLSLATLFLTSFSYACDEEKESACAQLCASLPCLYTIPGTTPAEERAITLTHLDLSKTVDSPEILNLFQEMFKDYETVRWNFSDSYYKSVVQRATQDSCPVPTLLIKDARLKNAHLLLIKEKITNTYCGYFSIKPYTLREIGDTHPLHPLHEKLVKQNNLLCDVGIFLMPDYRQKQIMTGVLPTLMKALAPQLKTYGLCLSIASAENHPVIHKLFERHPEFGFKRVNQEAYEGDFYYSLKG